MEYFWEKSGWEEEDRHLKALSEAPFQRQFPVLPEGPGLYFIRGPRQIGKSTWLKTLLKKSVPQLSYYLSCENIADYKELAELLALIESRSVLFLDEISFVKEWWRAIKHLVDQRADLRVILTGSHAFDIRSGMDQMPGRWGHGGEFELLPMDYSEFCRARKQANLKPLSHSDELLRYFQIGGFPIALIEAGDSGDAPKRSWQTYQRWLLGDLRKIGKQEVYLKELLLELAKTTCSTVSLQKLAQRTQIGSHNTAQDYIEVLDACFALKTLYAIDPNTGAPRFRKEKKFYLRDPLLYWMIFDWLGVPPPQNHWDQIAELVAHEHLCRHYDRFGYYSDRKGEIDFIQHKAWALEVKWQDQPERFSRAYIDLVIPKKIIWSKSTFLQKWP